MVVGMYISMYVHMSFEHAYVWLQRPKDNLGYYSLDYDCWGLQFLSQAHTQIKMWLCMEDCIPRRSHVLQAKERTRRTGKCMRKTSDKRVKDAICLIFVCIASLAVTKQCINNGGGGVSGVVHGWSESRVWCRCLILPSFPDPVMSIAVLTSALGHLTLIVFWDSFSLSWNLPSRVGWLTTKPLGFPCLCFLNTDSTKYHHICWFPPVLDMLLRSSCLHRMYCTHWAISPAHDLFLDFWLCVTV